MYLPKEPENAHFKFCISLADVEWYMVRMAEHIKAMVEKVEYEENFKKDEEPEKADEQKGTKADDTPGVTQ